MFNVGIESVTPVDAGIERGAGVRVVVAGQGRMGAGLLRAVVASGHDVVAVAVDGRNLSSVSRWARPKMSRLLGEGTLLGLAAKHRIEVLWLLGRGAQAVEALRSVRPDLLLVGDFGLILGPQLLDVPTVGCINTHWSLLPHHRGPNPASSVIVAGEKETGLTFHVMTPRIDAGDILDQTAFAIGPDDTPSQVYHRACVLAEERVVRLLDRVERDGLKGRAQDLSQGSYWRMRTHLQAELDWNRPAVELGRLVRGCDHPLAWFRYRHRILYVPHARVLREPVSAEPGTVVVNRPRVTVATGQGALRLEVVYCTRPIPMLWPLPWSRPDLGSQLNGSSDA